MGNLLLLFVSDDEPAVLVLPGKRALHRKAQAVDRRQLGEQIFSFLDDDRILSIPMIRFDDRNHAGRFNDVVIAVAIEDGV